MKVINNVAANRNTAAYVNGPVGFFEEINNEFKSAILEFMQCSVCAKYIHPPVTEICVNGHNACAYCVRKLKRCPICMLPANKNQNIGVENSCRNFKLKIPCNNQHLGCDAMNDIDEVNEHYEMCNYHNVSCPLAAPRGWCTWRGPVLEVRGHVATHHAECEIHETQLERIRLSYPCVDKKVVVIRGNEVFLVIIDFSPLSGLFGYACIRVEYCGSNENFPKFKYKFLLGNQFTKVVKRESYAVTTPEKTRLGELHVHVQNYSIDNIRKNRPLSSIRYTIIIRSASDSEVLESMQI